MTERFVSPILDRCPPSLPPSAYTDPERFEAERRRIWAREWVPAGRLADLAPGRMKPVAVAGESVLLIRDAAGTVTAFLNVCRHRNAELCAAEAPFGKLVRCPYHAWAYDSAGRLVSVGPALPTPDFRAEDHGLIPVAVRDWAGFLYLSLGDPPPPFAPDPGPDVLDAWPMAGLVRGHREIFEIECNWKVFWENFNECLHCPSVHPALVRRVPIYGRGIMSAAEAPDWEPGTPEPPALDPGRRSWTVSGRACGPEFPDLSEAQRAAGHHFVTIYPGHFAVAHVDYIRSVAVEPLAPERTRLTVDWLFAPEAMADPAFDLMDAVGFTRQVIAEDAAACEMNQRGLRSGRAPHGRLMPQEFDIARFHAWVAERMEGAG